MSADPILFFTGWHFSGFYVAVNINLFSPLAFSPDVIFPVETTMHMFPNNFQSYVNILRFLSTLSQNSYTRGIGVELPTSTAPRSNAPLCCTVSAMRSEPISVGNSYSFGTFPP